MLILGIETSCDETAVALVEDGHRILASEVASQVKLHQKYGGVVPELASRQHVQALVPLLETAFQRAALTPQALQGIAVTQGPGLVGALLVGFVFARAYAYARQLPWIGINHLLGHLYSVCLSSPEPEYPFVGLLVSGGHTNLYYVRSPRDAELLGQTRDDAAGEAFDKVAKLLHLGYPGGIVIDRLARDGDPQAVSFPRPLMADPGFDTSFSGLKSAVRRHVETHPDWPDRIPDLVSSFQEAVVEVLVHKLLRAADHCNCRRLVLAGGVAANSRLRSMAQAAAARMELEVFIPPLNLCGDNAAMIAGLGYHYLNNGQFSGDDADVYSRVPSAGRG